MSTAAPILSPLSHTHTCIKCGSEYTHSHNARDSHHEQLPFQCPNVNCIWFIEKGVGKRVPTEGYQSGVVETGRKPLEKPMSKKQKDFKRALDLGHITCSNIDHFTLVSVPGKQYPVLKNKTSLTLLRLMGFGKTAKCDCERAACEEACGWQDVGRFQNEYVAPHSYTLGVGVFNPLDTPKFVCPLPYTMSKSKFDVLVSRFPNWHFVTIGVGMHDHPVAHTSNMIAGFELQRRLARGLDTEPRTHFDLYGNPSSNMRFNARTKNTTVHTSYNLESTKDYIRQATKWGRPDDTCHEIALRDLGKTADPSSRAVAAWDAADSVFGVHTLYYCQPSELRDALARKPGKAARFLIHKFDSDAGSGTINDGEQRWVRSRRTDGKYEITQTNVGTGEVYTHPDVDMYFNSQSWFDGSVEDALTGSSSCLAWTVEQFSDDLFYIVMVACPAKAWTLTQQPTWTCQLTATDKHSRENVVANGGVEIKDGVFIPLEPKSYELFEDMRKRVMHRPRTAEKFESHVKMVLVRAKSVMVDKNTSFTAHELHNVCVSSFWCDFDRDVASDTQLLSGIDYWKQAQHTLVLKGKGFTAGNTFAKVASVTVLGLKAGGNKTWAAFVEGMSSEFAHFA